MVKYIYEFVRNYHDEVIGKNKHTVVYENKLFYYCKVNGSYELKQIRKEYVDNEKMNRFFTKHDDTIVLDKELVKVHREKEIKKEQQIIENLERQISIMNGDIKSITEHIANKKEKLAKLIEDNGTNDD